MGASTCGNLDSACASVAYPTATNCLAANGCTFTATTNVCAITNTAAGYCATLSATATNTTCLNVNRCKFTAFVRASVAVTASPAISAVAAVAGGCRTATNSTAVNAQCSTYTT